MDCAEDNAPRQAVDRPHQERPIICVSIAKASLQKSLIVEIILTALFHGFGYTYAFYGAIPKRLRLALGSMRFREWRNKVPQPIVEDDDDINAIASDYHGLVFKTKVKCNEYAPITVSLANNAQPLQEDLDECGKIQELVDTILALYERSPEFNALVHKGWLESVGPLTKFTFQTPTESSWLELDSEVLNGTALKQGVKEQQDDEKWKEEEESE